METIRERVLLCLRLNFTSPPPMPKRTLLVSPFTSSKLFSDFPCSHRQWRHPGHCAWVHGYSRSFHFEFGCDVLDECGFVVDFGGLKELKAFLDALFDHTLLLCTDDPLLPEFKAIEQKGGCSIVCLPYGIGMEGTARYLLESAEAHLVEARETRGVRVLWVEARENSKNSATYHNPQLL